MSDTDDPTLRQLGADLHQQLLEGDLTAPARISERFLASIVSKLKRKYPRLDDPHSAESAADDALLDYFNKPGQFLPEMGRLDAFLLMAAERDLLNILRGEKISGLPKRVNVVELDASDGEYITGDESLSVEEQVLLLISPVWLKLETLLPEIVDRDFLLLMMDGERSTQEFAAILGIGEQTLEQQFAEVKRHKDRIKKTIQRHLQRSELEEP